MIWAKSNTTVNWFNTKGKTNLVKCRYVADSKNLSIMC